MKNNLPDPIEAIKSHMRQVGWIASDLVRMKVATHSRMSEYINRKRKINLAFIRRYNNVAPETPLKVLIQDYKI